MHPRWLRCSSLKYSRYSRSSRLASGAPRRPRCDAGLSPRAARAACATLALAVGCSKPVAPPPVQEAAPAAPPAASTGNATVVGHGPRPNPGAQIVVVLEPTTSRSFPAQTDVPVIDQVSLTFGPELLLVTHRAAGGIPQQRRYPAQRARHARRNARAGLQRGHPNRQRLQATRSAKTASIEWDATYTPRWRRRPSSPSRRRTRRWQSPTGGPRIADVAPGAYTATLYAAGRKLQTRRRGHQRRRRVHDRVTRVRLKADAHSLVSAAA